LAQVLGFLAGEAPAHEHGEDSRVVAVEEVPEAPVVTAAHAAFPPAKIVDVRFLGSLALDGQPLVIAIGFTDWNVPVPVDYGSSLPTEIP
jgi:hypothetical protein